VGFIQNRKTRALGLTQQDVAGCGVHGLESIRGPRRVARDASDRGREVLVGGRVVTRRSKIQQVMPIHDVHQINVAVDAKIGIQRETQQPEVTPSADFLTDVDEQRPGAGPILLEPYLPGPFPDVHAAVILEKHADRFIPIRACRTRDSRFAESWRQGRRLKNGQR